MYTPETVQETYDSLTEGQKRFYQNMIGHMLNLSHSNKEMFRALYPNQQDLLVFMMKQALLEG